MNETKNETQKPSRRVVRSACGTYDYIFEGDETICVLLVPEVATPEYSQRVAEIIAAPELVAVCKSTQAFLNELFPQVNWGASLTNASTTRQLNEVPISLHRAIANAQGGEL